MNEAYKIAVALTMTSNAPAFLASLSRQILGVHANVKQLEGGFNRLHVAIGGGLMMASGIAVLGLWEKMTDQAADLTKQLTALKNFNLTPGQIADIDLTARRTAQNVRGSSEASNLHIATQAYSMFGVSGAKALMSELAKFAVVQGSITGDYEGSQNDIYELLRSGDLMGKLVNQKTHQVDISQLTRYLDIVAKVEAATHGYVDPETFLQVAKQGGVALSNLSQEGLLTMMMAAQGMGGFRAGTALMSSFRQFMGGRMTQPMAEEAKRLGLVGDYSVARGGHVIFPDKSLNTQFGQLLGQDPLAAAQYLVGVLQKDGKTDTKSQINEMFRIFGQQTEIRLFGDLIRNLPQMLSERSRIEGAAGLDRQYGNDTDGNLATAQYDLGQAWNNLMHAVAGPQASVEISIINQLADSLNWMADQVHKVNPEVLKNIGIGIGVLGVALTAGGAVALMAALGPVGWIAAGLVALGTALVAFKMDALKEIAAGFVQIFDGVRHLNIHEIIAGIGKVWDGEFHLLPDMVRNGIISAVNGIGNIIKDAWSFLMGKIHDFASQMSYTGSGPSGGSFIRASYTSASVAHNAEAIAAAIELDRARRGATGASLAAQTIQITTPVNLDGRTIAKVVTKYQVKAATMPTAVTGSPDTFGSYIGPGTTLQGV